MNGKDVRNLRVEQQKINILADNYASNHPPFPLWQGAEILPDQARIRYKFYRAPLT
jgi:hypothetical protein